MRMMQGIFYGIGVGPGDPELLTCKAARILSEVEAVAVPVAEKGKESTAYGIAFNYIRPGCEIISIDFPMTRDRIRLEKAWAEARSALQGCLDQGRSIAFLTLGDPMLYSTYIYLFYHLREKGYRVETVPGISAFSAAAASAGVPLALGDEKMALMPGEAAVALSSKELSSFETLVLFKVSGCYEKVLAALKLAGRLPGTILVQSCGMPGEIITSDLEAEKVGELSYFSLLISRKEPFNL